ncbi:DUF4184 family protein [Chitinophaga nivalis]|uniref:DUF4184 family protein n=1 Tax=Chitinophaga nivalis TaxID=2991709 RepID=A0ABT3IU72_9BACT|nr:DUF4184 family protein [Chitinophaga nivalis]MCW3463056.1 DUF4184 family protein [Chitinophaga nivalis]MCW3487254.1 DUF4184 family protein [Chitinophaga nivalis]
MPFTISHIAIVTPLTGAPRRYLSATGLMIGSMVPDFLYFILLNPYFKDGHQWWGIFVYDIPLSLLLAYLYHYLLKSSLLHYAPEWAAQRLNRFRYFDWDTYFRQHYLVVTFSIIIGVLTHFFLDAFTHGHGYFTIRMPLLQGTVTIAGHTIKTWYLLQYLSSVAGLAILFYVFLKIRMIPKNAVLPAPHKTRFWVTVAFASVLVLVINEYLHPIRCQQIDYLAVIMGGIFYGFLLTSLLYRPGNRA